MNTLQPMPLQYERSEPLYRELRPQSSEETVFQSQNNHSDPLETVELIRSFDLIQSSAGNSSVPTPVQNDALSHKIRSFASVCQKDPLYRASLCVSLLSHCCQEMVWQITQRCSQQKIGPLAEYLNFTVGSTCNLLMAHNRDQIMARIRANPSVTFTPYYSPYFVAIVYTVLQLGHFQLKAVSHALWYQYGIIIFNMFHVFQSTAGFQRNKWILADDQTLTHWLQFSSTSVVLETALHQGAHILGRHIATCSEHIALLPSFQKIFPYIILAVLTGSYLWQLKFLYVKFKAHAD